MHQKSPISALCSRFTSLQILALSRGQWLCWQVIYGNLREDETGKVPVKKKAESSPFFWGGSMIWPFHGKASRSSRNLHDEKWCFSPLTFGRGCWLFETFPWKLFPHGIRSSQMRDPQVCTRGVETCIPCCLRHKFHARTELLCGICHRKMDHEIR